MSTFVGTTAVTEATSALVRARAQLIEQLISTLGWCGYWPTRIDYRGESQAILMRDTEWLAVVTTHWPALDSDDAAVRLSFVFMVPPLAPKRPTFLDAWWRS